MYSNGGLGIDLGGDGITPNDSGDEDSGPNDLMNSPAGVSAYYDALTNRTTIPGHRQGKGIAWRYGKSCQCGD